MEYEVKPIRNAITLLTNQCPCACEYCFEDKDSRRMTYQIAQDTLNFVHKAPGQLHGYTFFGGEPMLEFENIIVPLVEYSYSLPNTTRFAMTTNGVLLDHERIDWLLDNNINFMVSMDGAKETQDTNRPLKSGGSSFDALDKNIHYLIERKPNQMFRVTLTGKTIHNLFSDILYFEEIGVKDLGILPNLFEVWNDEQCKIFDEQIEMYENYIIESFNNGRTPLLFREYYASFSRLYQLQNTTMRRINNACLPTFQCGFGVRGSASVDVNGYLYGCHHITPLSPESEWCIGNIYSGVDESKVRNLVDNYDQFKVQNEQCKNCPLDKVCNGGCAPNNYMICGDVHKVPDTFCYWTRSITDSAYRITQILGNANNELFIQVFNYWKGVR